jgi:Zn-dependent protease with chaperone function
MTPTAPLPSPPAGRPDPKRREPLWDRVDRNRLLLIWYLLLFAVGGAFWFTLQVGLGILLVAFVLVGAEHTESVLSLAGLLGGSPGEAVLRLWLIGFAIAVVYEASALARSEKRIAGLLGAELVPKGELYDTKLVLKDMAIASGQLVAPALYTIPGNSTNAFVAQAPGRRPIVGVTRGFPLKLSLDEQRGVFANLAARLKSGDVMVATAVTGLLAPLETWRDERLKEGADDTLQVLTAGDAAKYGDYDLIINYQERQRGRLALFIFSVVFVFLGEMVAAVHRRSQRRAAEKADAEGMLLLKDPRSMLSALQRCVELDNVVPQSGPAFGELFYCWPGPATNDADDPEWQRVARLREVVGIDGWVELKPTAAPVESLYPTPPRLEGDSDR